MIVPWHAAAVLAAALAIDAAFGEYPTPVHPVVWMGRTIELFERGAPRAGRIAQLAHGALIAVAVPALFATAAWALLRALAPWPLVHFAVEVLLLKATFAVRALGGAAFRVERALARGAIDDAREGLRSLCSREPSSLNEEQLVAATVESVAENASDSFVAPVFFYSIFGIPGAIAYRAINTLDAMIGYHGKYEYLGKASARVDDLANLLPARITAVLFVLAGAATGADARRGVRTWLRDGASTESPNAGRPMATMAGLLRVTLEKEGHYRLGDAVEPLALAKVRAAFRVVVVAVGFAALFALAVAGARLAPPR